MVVPRLNIRDHDRRMASTRSLHDRTDADLYPQYDTPYGGDDRGECSHAEYGAPYTSADRRAAQQQGRYQNRPQGHAQERAQDDVRNLGFWHDQFESEEEADAAPDPQEWEERQSPMTYALAIAILVVISASGWFLYRWISPPQAAGEIPVIYPEEGPYKIRPENPGGMVIPHQDKLVYGRLSPRSNEAQTVEHLLPPPEEPMEYAGVAEGDESAHLPAYAESGAQMAPVNESGDNQRYDQENRQLGHEAVYVPEVYEASPQSPSVPRARRQNGGRQMTQMSPHPQEMIPPLPPVATAPSAQKPETQKPADAQDPLDFSDITRLIEEQAEANVEEAQRPALSPFSGSRTASSSVNRAPEQKAAVMPDSGVYVVQIATVPSFEAGEREWQRMKKAAAAALKGKGMMLEKSGKSYRLVVGPFTTMTQARQLAEKLEVSKIKGVVMSAGHE